MKKNDWILAAGAVIFACLLGILLYCNQSQGNYAVITVDGEEYGCYRLDKDQVIEINRTNRLKITDGEAVMVYAECPDQICVHMMPASKEHDMIVCLPNKVIIEILEK